MVKLFELLLPTHDNNHELFPIDVHYEFDYQVTQISSGLTVIENDNIGVFSKNNRLSRERVFSVRIACNNWQIKQIAKLAKKHYKQDSIIYYVVSNEVYFV